MNTEFNDGVVDEIVSLCRTTIKEANGSLAVTTGELLVNICIASAVIDRLERIARAIEALVPDDGT